MHDTHDTQPRPYSKYFFRSLGYSASGMRYANLWILLKLYRIWTTWISMITYIIIICSSGAVVAIYVCVCFGGCAIASEHFESWQLHCKVLITHEVFNGGTRQHQQQQQFFSILVLVKFRILLGRFSVWNIICKFRNYASMFPITLSRSYSIVLSLQHYWPVAFTIVQFLHCAQ